MLWFLYKLLFRMEVEKSSVHLWADISVRHFILTLNSTIILILQIKKILYLNVLTLNQERININKHQENKQKLHLLLADG